MEIESHTAWYGELRAFLSEALDDPAVSKEEYAGVVVQASRVLLRLKDLHEKMSEVV